jgi:putative ABC transport system ATP-binding protein
MIHIEGLTKSFRDGDAQHEVLCGVDLDIAAGDFVALIGRSGSGKSTLLHCLAGIETASKGTISIDGIELTSLDETARTHLRRDRIGIIFQFFHLLPALSVRDNVELPAQLRGDAASAIRERSDALLEELGLLDRATQFPDRLSGGEQQRVAIARALINEPSLLLADEPTGNLDVDTAESILELFREIHQKHGVTILMATHSEEAAAAATRTAELIAGEIEWTPEPEPEPESESDEETEDPLAPSSETKNRSTHEADEAERTPGITVSDRGSTEGVRPSAKAAELFGEKPTPAEALDEVVEEALAEDSDEPERVPDPEPEPESEPEPKSS